MFVVLKIGVLLVIYWVEIIKPPVETREVFGEHIFSIYYNYSIEFFSDNGSKSNRNTVRFSMGKGKVANQLTTIKRCKCCNLPGYIRSYILENPDGLGSTVLSRRVTEMSGVDINESVMRIHLAHADATEPVIQIEIDNKQAIQRATEEGNIEFFQVLCPKIRAMILKLLEKASEAIETDDIPGYTNAIKSQKTLLESLNMVTGFAEAATLDSAIERLTRAGYKILDDRVQGRESIALDSVTFEDIKDRFLLEMAYKGDEK